MFFLFDFSFDFEDGWDGNNGCFSSFLGGNGKSVPHDEQ